MMRREAPMEPNILCCLFYKQVAPIEPECCTDFL
jgi:hypothetical protein